MLPMIIAYSKICSFIGSRFFFVGFMACQDYFTHFEPNQSLGGAKTGDRREKPPDERGLSHM